MDQWYGVLFYAVGAATAVSVWFTRGQSDSQEKRSPAFHSFQWTYLMVYYLMVAGDWLQGPYVYALYDAYGFSQENIAVLFVAGFGSSMVFGTFIGSLADRMGRKSFCLLYVALYIISCMTKHVKRYDVLMVGRLLGGISTSLLFSVFDAWMVCEHNDRQFPSSWLADTFSKSAFGNSVVAIVCGVVAQYAADAQPLTPISEGSSIYAGGFCSPFDLAIAALALGGSMIAYVWSENYGSRSLPSSTDDTHPLCDVNGLKQGAQLVQTNSSIALCGWVQSLFEGAMYVFVFMWTPTLTPEGDHPPYGKIFATFMLACMTGSTFFSYLIKHFSAEAILFRLLAVSSVCLFIPFLSNSLALNMVSFLIFEVCVGLYFPAMGTVKSKLVPEEARAALYNIFRIPLNAIVLGVLLSDLSPRTAFLVSSILLAVSAVLQARLR